jgi:hypothetical protein
MEPSTAAAPAIPHEELLPKLKHFYFNKRTVQILQREPAFGELRYRSHQIYFVYDFTQRNGDRVLSVRQFSRAFGCDAGRVKAALANGLNESKVSDCHFAFDDDSEIEILEWIQSQAEKYESVTRTDIRHYCEAKYSRSISRGWIDSLILRNREDLLETKSTPQAKARLEVSRAFLDETIRCLREHVQGMKAELIFNLGEAGMSEWEDRQEKKVIVLRTMEGQTIHHRESRSVRYISIITCITARGEFMTPYIVTLQDSDAIRKRLMRHGVRLGVDFVLRQRSKPYVRRKFSSSTSIQSLSHT